MERNSFFKKAINFLIQVNKGTHIQLIENGWITKQDALKINIVLMDLGLIAKKDERIFLTRKGLNILLYYKMGKISQDYNKDVLSLIIMNKSDK